MDIIQLITSALTLLTVTEDGQKRKNLRAVRKSRKKLYRMVKKDGITEEEQKLLSKLDNAIVECAISLSEF